MQLALNGCSSVYGCTNIQLHKEALRERKRFMSGPDVQIHRHSSETPWISDKFCCSLALLRMKSKNPCRNKVCTSLHKKIRSHYKRPHLVPINFNRNDL